MNICIVFPTDLRFTSGSSVYALSLTRGLSERGDNVHLICLDTSPLGTVNVHRVALPIRHPLIIPPYGDVSGFEILRSINILQANVDRLLDVGDIDIIDCHYVSFTSYGVLKSALAHRKPVVITSQGRDISIAYRHRSYRRFIDICMQYCDGIVTPSRSVQELICSRFHLSENKTCVVTGGVDIRLFNSLNYKRQLEDCFNIFFVGRLSPEKGVATLIRAASHLSDIVPNILVHIMGGGPLLEQLRELAQSLGLSENVRFYDHLDHEKVPAHLVEADIFVMPSLVEGFSNAVVEAMAMGKPIVGSDVGMLREIYRYNAGILFKPGEDNSLAKAILHLYRDEEARLVLGEKGREIVKRYYSLDKSVDKLAAFYEQVISQQQSNNSVASSSGSPS